MAVGIAYGVYPWHSSAYDSQERMALKREGSKDIQGVPRPDSELKHELLCTNSNMYMRCEWWHLRLWRPPNDSNGHAWPQVDLNNLCYHAFMASKYFLEMVKSKEGNGLWSIDLLGAMALARKNIGANYLMTSSKWKMLVNL